MNKDMTYDFSNAKRGAAMDKPDIPRAELEERLEKAKEALQFYADNLGNSKSVDIRIITTDGGLIARQALEEL